jgi:hypothetical protein
MNRLLFPMLRLFMPAAAIIVLASPVCAEDQKPTREAFLVEVLDAKPTSVTPKFDDYTPGSYHIEKEDLLKGLIEAAKKRKQTLRSITILGPMPNDPLWTSRVVVFFQDGEKIRVNSLVMAHARITNKSTGLITGDQFKKWRDRILDTGSLKKEVPAADAKKDTPPAFAAQLLLVIWSQNGKTQEVHYGDVVQAEKVEKAEKLRKEYNAVLEELTRTYPEKDK